MDPAAGGCGTILWDFDGTLAWREGLWSGCVAEAVRAVDPRLRVSAADVRPLLASGYPWHEPDVAHEGLDPEQWWARLTPVLVRAIEALGVTPDRSAACAAEVRRSYVDPAGFRLFDDVRPVLSNLAERGWRHVILSNHVPELPGIAGALGLGDLVEHVLTSAATGFEKPHPRAYETAREWCTGEALWMIGDDYAADVAGAEAAGIPAILVRREDPRAGRWARDLYGVADYVSG